MASERPKLYSECLKTTNATETSVPGQPARTVTGKTTVKKNKASSASTTCVKTKKPTNVTETSKPGQPTRTVGAKTTPKTKPSPSGSVQCVKTKSTNVTKTTLKPGQPATTTDSPRKDDIKCSNASTQTIGVATSTPKKRQTSSVSTQTTEVERKYSNASNQTTDKTNPKKKFSSVRTQTKRTSNASTQTPIQFVRKAKVDSQEEKLNDHTQTTINAGTESTSRVNAYSARSSTTDSEHNKSSRGRSRGQDQNSNKNTQDYVYPNQKKFVPILSHSRRYFPRSPPPPIISRPCPPYPFHDINKELSEVDLNLPQKYMKPVAYARRGSTNLWYPVPEEHTTPKDAPPRSLSISNNHLAEPLQSPDVSSEHDPNFIDEAAGYYVPQLLCGPKYAPADYCPDLQTYPEQQCPHPMEHPYFQQYEQNPSASFTTSEGYQLYPVDFGFYPYQPIYYPSDFSNYQKQWVEPQRQLSEAIHIQSLQQALKQSPEQMPLNLVKHSSENLVENKLGKTLVQILDNTTQEQLEDMPEQSPENLVEQASRNPLEQAPDNPLEQAPDNTPKQMLVHSIIHSQGNEGNTLTDQALDSSVIETTVKKSDNTPEQTVHYTLKQAIDTPEQVPNKLMKEVQGSAPEQVHKTSEVAQEQVLSNIPEIAQTSNNNILEEAQYAVPEQHYKLADKLGKDVRDNTPEQTMYTSSELAEDNLVKQALESTPDISVEQSVVTTTEQASDNAVEHAVDNPRHEPVDDAHLLDEAAGYHVDRPSSSTYNTLSGYVSHNQLQRERYRQYRPLPCVQRYGKYPCDDRDQWQHPHWNRTAFQRNFPEEWARINDPYHEPLNIVYYQYLNKPDTRPRTVYTSPPVPIESKPKRPVTYTQSQLRSECETSVRTGTGESATTDTGLSTTSTLANSRNSSLNIWRNHQYDQWMGTVNPGGKIKDLVSDQEALNFLGGRVPMELVVGDYTKYQKTDTTDNDMLHVLECYDFPARYSTKDIRRIFEVYVNQGLFIKWVDDTHLMLVFWCKEAAEEALRFQWRGCKLRRFADASPLSQYIAMRCALQMTCPPFRGDLEYDDHNEYAPYTPE